MPTAPPTAPPTDDIHTLTQDLFEIIRISKYDRPTTLTAVTGLLACLTVGDGSSRWASNAAREAEIKSILAIIEKALRLYSKD